MNIRSSKSRTNAFDSTVANPLELGKHDPLAEHARKVMYQSLALLLLMIISPFLFLGLLIAIASLL